MAILAAYPVGFAGVQASLLGTIGVAALLLTVVAASGVWLSAVGWALGLVGVEYLASLYLAGQGLGVATPIYAALMLLVAELVYLARQLDVPLAPGEAVLRRRLGLILGLLLASLLAGSLLLALAVLPLAAGVALTALGTAAGVGVIGLVVWAGRRS